MKYFPKCLGIILFIFSSFFIIGCSKNESPNEPTIKDNNIDNGSINGTFEIDKDLLFVDPPSVGLEMLYNGERYYFVIPFQRDKFGVASNFPKQFEYTRNTRGNVVYFTITIGGIAPGAYNISFSATAGEGTAMDNQYFPNVAYKIVVVNKGSAGSFGTLKIPSDFQ